MPLPIHHSSSRRNDLLLSHALCPPLGLVQDAFTQSGFGPCNRYRIRVAFAAISTSYNTSWTDGPEACPMTPQSPPSPPPLEALQVNESNTTVESNVLTFQMVRVDRPSPPPRSQCAQAHVVKPTRPLRPTPVRWNLTKRKPKHSSDSKPD